MKKIRFFGLLLAALALIVGCDSNTPVPENTAKNAFYWAETPNGKNIIIGIVDPASVEKAAFAPKTGYLYAVWLASDSDTASPPISKGTITVEDAKLTFTPSSDSPAGGFSGTLADGVLEMESIPAAGLGKITLEEGGTFTYDPSDPAGSLPDVPNSNGNGPTDGTLFRPGRHVVDVVLIDPPSVTTAYEGFPVDLTGMKVEITYDNGDKATKTAENANDFIVIPPVYVANNSLHGIQYIAEYNKPYSLKSLEASREFRAPYTDAAKGTFFYEITNTGTDLQVTVASDKEYFEGDPAFDFTGVGIIATYSNGAKTITPTAVYKTQFLASNAPADSRLMVEIGRKLAYIPIKHNKVHPLLSISVSTPPDFSDHILFDDPRFFPSESADAEWLSRFSGATLKLSYSGLTVTKTANIIKAYCDGRIELTNPVNLTQSKPKIFIRFKEDYNPNLNEERDIKTSLVVPVYNRLASISVEPLVPGLIVLKGNGPQEPDDEQSFLKQVKISAVYQVSSDKNKTVKRPNVLVYPPESSYFNVDFDSELIAEAEFKTNVNRPLIAGDGGILTKANSKSYDEKNKLQKAKVTFTTKSPGEFDPLTDRPEATKSATIEVGVTGYIYESP